MQDEAAHSIHNALAENAARRRMWEEMIRHEGWRELVQYLEKRFLEIGRMDASSLKDLSARNARLNEIRKIFEFIRHDFKLEDALIREYQALSSLEDELPLPHIPL